MTKLERNLAHLELGLTFKLASTILHLACFGISLYFPFTIFSIVLIVTFCDLIGGYLCCSAPIGLVGGLTSRLAALTNFGCFIVPMSIFVNGILKKYNLPYSDDLASMRVDTLLNTIVLCDLAARILFFVFLAQLAGALNDPDSQMKAGVTAIMLLLIYFCASVVRDNFHPKERVWPLLALIPMVPLSIFYMERYMRCLYDLKQGVSMALMKASEQANMPEPMRT